MVSTNTSSNLSSEPVRIQTGKEKHFSGFMVSICFSSPLPPTNKTILKGIQELYVPIPTQPQSDMSISGGQGLP